MLNAKDVGEIFVFLIGGLVLSLIFWSISPLIAGVIVGLIMAIVKTFFKGTTKVHKTKGGNKNGIKKRI